MAPQTHFAALASALLLSSFAESSFASSNDPLRLGIEVDPIPFFEHGFSVHAEMKPFSRVRLTLGAFGLRSSPTSGPNQGFTAETRAGELSVQYFVLPFSGGGLFAGIYGFFQNWEYERSDVSGSASAYWLTPAAAAGFQWLPWKKGPYVTPWAAFGLPIRRGSHQVGRDVYDDSGPFEVLALHIGYEFAP